MVAMVEFYKDGKKNANSSKTVNKNPPYTITTTIRKTTVLTDASTTHSASHLSSSSLVLSYHLFAVKRIPCLTGFSISEVFMCQLLLRYFLVVEFNCLVPYNCKKLLSFPVATWANIPQALGCPP